MKYALFLGCAIPIKYPGFEAATRQVCARLGIELLDLPFSCCPPTSSMKLVHYESWLALAARNLCLAEEAGLDLLTLCSGCVNTLKEANHVLRQSESRKRKVNKLLEEHNHSFRGTIEVTHILDVLYQDVMVERLIKEKVRDIPLRVGCHYGCHYFRPPKVMYPEELSDAESYVPVKMDHLLSIIGVEPTEFSRKFLCCGSPLGANVDQDAGYAITRQKLSYIQERNIQALSVICPSCFEQFDLGQIVLSRKTKDGEKIPTFFLTQLVGLALGLSVREVGLDVHRVKAKKLLDSINII
ncbi:MAG: CoB--CoM heterodisulfide reductase iron-sulfur subunit B family protein [Deltaproteobacteria bacterium]|jgi:heterodisulfide reductase subunit B|nr:CoB--CoM heterodisulfide reductase iron-sulfur subunit B family protein [Deltaproteobacteria bacterium]